MPLRPPHMSAQLEGISCWKSVASLARGVSGGPQGRPGHWELSSAQFAWSYSVAVTSVKFQESQAWPNDYSLEPV